MGYELNSEFPQICGFKLELEMLLDVFVQKCVHTGEKKKIQWELPVSGWQPSTRAMLELLHSLVQ